MMNYEEVSWEPLGNLHCDRMLQDYYKRMKKAGLKIIKILFAN